MGNHSSKQQPVVDVTLVPQTQVVVAPDGCIPPVFVATKLRVERVNGDLQVFERDTGEMLFRYDDKSSENYFKRFLVDAKARPIVILEKTIEIQNNFVVKAPESPHETLFKIHSSTFNFIVGMKLEFTDRRTNEKVTLDVDGDWRVRRAAMWLTRSSRVGQHDPICTMAFRDGGYDVDMVSGVDVTLVALLCIILNETVNDFSYPPPFSGAMMLDGALRK